MPFYWYLGWLLVPVVFLMGIIMYAKTSKFYSLAYIAAGGLYLFTVDYLIEAFKLSKNGIVLALFVSSLIAIGVGIYLFKSHES